MDRPLHPTLQNTPVDRAQKALRSLSSLIDVCAPGVGSVFAELVSVVLPANREERLAAFATALHRSLEALGDRLDDVVARLDAEQLALFEDGLRASARATQEARIERIGAIVAAGFSESTQAVRQREVLEMLSTLSDQDLGHLAKFANRWGRYASKVEKSFSVGEWQKLSENERQLIHERQRLRELSLHKLTWLGLTETRYGLAPERIGSDEITVKEQEIRLTSLGHFFCVHIGLWPDGVPPPSLE